MTYRTRSLIVVACLLFVLMSMFQVAPLLNIEVFGHDLEQMGAWRLLFWIPVPFLMYGILRIVLQVHKEKSSQIKNAE